MASDDAVEWRFDKAVHIDGEADLAGPRAAGDDLSGVKDKGADRITWPLGLLFGLGGIGASAVVVALSDMAKSLDISPAGSAWVISTYAIAQAVGTAVHGRIADVAGLRRALTMGVGMMGGGALLAAAAPTLPVVLGARALQGAGAGAVWVLCSGVINAKYEGPVRVRALGRVAATAAGLSALGPLLGGLLVPTLGWRAAVALPVLGIPVGALLWRTVPHVGRGGSVDYRGAAYLSAVAAGIVLVVQSVAAGLVVASVGVALVVAGSFILRRHVRKRPRGFLPLSVVQSPTVLTSAIAAAAVPAAWFALLIAVPAVLLARGWNPVGVGLLLSTSALVAFFGPRLAARLVARLHPLQALLASEVLVTSALLLSAAAAAVGSAELLLVAVFAVALAFGVAQPALAATVALSVDASVRGVALGTATLIFLVGGGVGSALVGGLGPALGYSRSLLILLVLPLAGSFLIRHHARRAGWGGD